MKKKQKDKMENKKKTERLGIIFSKRKKGISAIRKTRESEIKGFIEQNKRRNLKISTGLAFLDHMIEMISWRANLNIDITVKTKSKLTHMIAEDTGIVLGNLLRKLFEDEIRNGINGNGFAISAIDEALAIAVVSVEGRANNFFCFEERKLNLRFVEDVRGTDLIAFLEGLTQGFGATIHLRVLEGKDPHHLWEAVFRALGDALKKVFERNTWRKGAISGVKGTLK